MGNISDAKAARQPLRPDEVLFKQSNAPVRYEEMDYYYAHTKLPSDQRLPSGDLLSSLHAYISKLYSRTGEPGAQKAWKCMDETALIALGILMEETAKEMLGDTGDLAFTEAADEEEEEKGSQEDDGVEEGPTRPGSSTEKQPSDPWSSSEDGSRYTTDESDQ